MSSPVLIVTGASRGLGKSIAFLSITKLNARVVAVARSQELLHELVNEVEKVGKSSSLEIVVGDVTDEKVDTQVIDRAIDKWGKIDSIVANAGVIEPIAAIGDAPLQEWRYLFDVNLFSIIHLVQEALPHLRKTKGRVITVSSTAATKSYHGCGAYGASKAALNHFTTTLGIEESDITAIAIYPGIVNTEMQYLIREKGSRSMKEDEHLRFIDLYRSGKLISPDESGFVIAALAIRATHDLSTQFLSWDDEMLQSYRA